MELGSQESGAKALIVQWIKNIYLHNNDDDVSFPPCALRPANVCEDDHPGGCCGQADAKHWPWHHRGGS